MAQAGVLGLEQRRCVGRRHEYEFRSAGQSDKHHQFRVDQRGSLHGHVPHMRRDAHRRRLLLGHQQCRPARQQQHHRNRIPQRVVRDTGSNFWTDWVKIQPAAWDIHADCGQAGLCIVGAWIQVASSATAPRPQPLRPLWWQDTLTSLLLLQQIPPFARPGKRQSFLLGCGSRERGNGP